MPPVAARPLLPLQLVLREATAGIDQMRTSWHMSACAAAAAGTRLWAARRLRLGARPPANLLPCLLLPPIPVQPAALDHQRNRVLRVDLFVGVMSLCAVIAALPAAYFGAAPPLNVPATAATAAAGCDRHASSRPAPCTCCQPAAV